MEKYQKIKIRAWAKLHGVKLVTGSELHRMRTSGKSKYLGAGAQGYCSRLRAADGQEFALKVFDQTNDHGEILHEARRLHTNKGPGVQSLYGLCPESNVMISQYAGKTVSHCLRKKRLTKPQKVCVLERVMKTIGTMLKRKQCHNDIKENNICVKCLGRREPEVTLIDFGLSERVGSQLYDFSTCFGDDYSWIAPELFTGGRCSEQTEVYSLGNLANKLLAKDCPEGLQEWVRRSRCYESHQRLPLELGIQEVENYRHFLEARSLIRRKSRCP